MKIAYTLAAIVFIMLCLTACSSIKTIETKTLDSEGRVISIKTETIEEPTIAKKSYTVTNQTTAFRAKTTPDSATASSSWIELIFGTSVTSVQVVSPVESNESTSAMYTVTKQTSVWADMFGTSSSSGTESYIAASGETAEQTAIRIKALREASILKTETVKTEEK
jgi:hypothetical protein